MKKNFFLFLVMITLAEPALYPQAADTLTLEDTIKYVLHNNAAIAEATDAEAIVNAKIGQSRSALYPDVKGEASYDRIGPAPQLSIPNIGKFELFPHDNYDIHIAGSYLLYDFKRTRETVHLAETQLDTVKDRLETIKRDLVYQTTQIFYTILFLQENINVQDKHIRLLNEHLTMAQKKIESGTATELEALITEVRLASAQSQAVELQSSLEKQQIVIRKLMGLPTGTILKLKGEFVLKNPDIDAPQLIKKALNDRIEIKTVNDALQTAQVQSSVARLNNKPSLRLVLLGGVKDGYIPDLTKPFLNFVAGVQFDAPIFDGYRSKNLRTEASANIKMIEDRKRDVEEMIKSEVLQALTDLQANNKKLAMLDINIRLAEKAVAFAQTRYEAGTVTNLDLLDAEEARTDAEFLRLQALYRCVLSAYTLQRAIGLTING